MWRATAKLLFLWLWGSKSNLWHWARQMLGLCESLSAWGHRRDLTVAPEASSGSSLKLHLNKMDLEVTEHFLLLVFAHSLSLLWNVVSPAIKLLAPFVSSLLVTSSGRLICGGTSPKTEGEIRTGHSCLIRDCSAADILVSEVANSSSVFVLSWRSVHAAEVWRRVHVLSFSCLTCLISCEYVVTENPLTTL